MVINTLQTNDDKFTAKETIEMKLKLFSTACFSLILITACSPTPSEKDATKGIKNELVRASQQNEERHEHVAHQHEEKHEHTAHQHGRATLTVAWSNKDLAIDLQTPAYNILGFEYAPSTAEEKKRVVECIETLKTEGLIEPLADAKCAIIAADVQTGFGAENKSTEEKTNHSDFDVFYTVKCQNPDALKTIDASGLFAAFSNLTTLHVQWISDRGQSAQTLTPKHPILFFD